MTPDTQAQTDFGNGFWRLQHEHLAAALARHDLSGEQLRVYLALADLTRGYGRERDVVSIGQIAEHTGNLRRPHVVRALHVLEESGLYGQAPAKGQSVTRWVVWPPPPVPDAGNTPATVPALGNTTVPTVGNGTVPKAVPALGKHQDTKKEKKEKKPSRGEKAAASVPEKRKSKTKSPPDPRVKTFIDFFCKTYAAAVGKPYIVTGGKDGATIKRLLAAVGGNGIDPLQELQQATGNMLADTWGRGRASIGLLASQINSWRSKATSTPGDDDEQSRRNWQMIQEPAR